MVDITVSRFGPYSLSGASANVSRSRRTNAVSGSFILRHFLIHPLDQALHEPTSITHYLGTSMQHLGIIASLCRYSVSQQIDQSLRRVVRFSDTRISEEFSRVPSPRHNGKRPPTAVHLPHTQHSLTFASRQGFSHVSRLAAPGFPLSPHQTPTAPSVTTHC